MPQSDGLAEGEVFAGYTIVRRLGTGGMGQVYLAQHPRLPRRDALKILPRELTANDEFRQRFNREADLAANDEPAFSFRVPAAATNGKAIDVEIIRRDRIQPAVVRREWARAAIVAANGLDVAPS
jgi:serine/threonine protein kinase